MLASTRDLAGGTPLEVGDLTTLTLPTSVVPAGALLPGAEPVGRPLIGPVRAGEMLTDVTAEAGSATRRRLKARARPGAAFSSPSGVPHSSARVIG